MCEQGLQKFLKIVCEHALLLESLELVPLLQGSRCTSNTKIPFPQGQVSNDVQV